MKQSTGRVVDVNGRKVTLLSAAQYHTLEWTGDLPASGDVYEMRDGAAGRKLCTGGLGGDVLRWRNPDAQGRTRFDALRRRHEIKRAVRDYLHGEDFIEIDMPLLVRGATPDAEIDSFRVGDRYLVTSTEYQIKRMEIGGFDRCYTLTQNFRAGDTGRYRNPEFTMLEWARVGGTLEDIEHDMEEMIRRAHGAGSLTYQGHAVDLSAPFDRLTVGEAVRRATGVMLDDFTAPSFLKAIRAAGIQSSGIDDTDAPHLFSLLMDWLQESLGFGKPVFIREWPRFQTSSAREDAQGRFVERSELFIAGIELSDGFPSLTDAVRQEETFKLQNARRRHIGKDEVETDAAYLAAMREGFPSGAGMAMGFDRLVMLLTDRPDLASVLAYDWDEL